MIARATEQSAQVSAIQGPITVPARVLRGDKDEKMSKMEFCLTDFKFFLYLCSQLYSEHIKR
jgi:hypothetical protein